MPDAPSDTESPLDFATPYELMVGVWSGMATLFDAQGQFRSMTPSMVCIYWKLRPTLLHYRQLQEDFSVTGGQPSIKSLPAQDSTATGGITADAAIVQIAKLHFDLQVSGKYCKGTAFGSPSLQSVEGTETRPGVYIFHLGFNGGRYYNNQYFTDANERHIIGPYVQDGSPQVASVIAQAFTRVSYRVPPKLQSEIASQ
jgi:hypothetical protein